MTEQRQRIERALTALVFDQPFFAVLAMRLEIQETAEVDTFATDGKRLLYNPQFCSELEDKQIITVLAHEVLHCAMGHIWRTPLGADHLIWNMAIDNEANWELEEANIRAKHSGEAQPFPWPSCGKCMEDRFKGWAAERVYTVLSQEQLQNQNQQGQQGQGKENNQSKSKSGKNQKPGKGFGDIIEGAQQDKSLKQTWEQAVVQAAKATEKSRGHIPGAIKELIEEITSNKIDWKGLLRDFLSTVAHEDWSFRQPNTRYTASEFMLPSLYNEKIGELIFAVDTSGSIGSDLLAEFIAEAQIALDELNPESLTLIYADSKIQKIKTYEPGDKIKLEAYGRGGTDFRPVFKWCNKRDSLPRVLVYLTDLEGNFPNQEPEFPTLWISTYGDKVPFGDLINI